MRGPQTVRTYRARSLRKADNDAERALWLELKDRRLAAAKFTRQFPIGPYFADFCCRAGRLVIEVDGSHHSGSKSDRVRDDFMIDQGWSVLRFSNVDVLRSREAVLDTILAALDGRLDPVDVADLRYVRAERQ